MEWILREEENLLPCWEASELLLAELLCLGLGNADRRWREALYLRRGGGKVEENSLHTGGVSTGVVAAPSCL